MSDPQTGHDSALTVSVTVAVSVLTGLYTAAQLSILTGFASLIARYKTGDLLLTRMRQVTRSQVVKLEQETPGLVEEIIAASANDGASAATPPPPGVPDTHPFGVAGEPPESHAERSVRAIRDDLQGKLNGLGYRITRFADDAYQAVTTDAAVAQVLGLTPAEAQHQAYERLAAKGIDGFTDSRGRRWELNAYVDAAVRTAAQRAFNVSLLDRMLSTGISYFTVTDDGAPCPLCEPWQGEILTMGVPDQVAAHTVAEATAAGLFHPRCKHVLVGYFPGVSSIPAPHPWTPADQKRYDDSQKQRALERAIRAAKRVQAAAYTPAMKTAAGRRVRAAQKNMRDFITQTGRVRIPHREQLHL